MQWERRARLRLEVGKRGVQPHKNLLVSCERTQCRPVAVGPPVKLLAGGLLFQDCRAQLHWLDPRMHFFEMTQHSIQARYLSSSSRDGRWQKFWIDTVLVRRDHKEIGDPARMAERFPRFDFLPPR